MRPEAFKCVLGIHYSILSFYATSQSIPQGEIDCRNREMLSNKQNKGKAFIYLDYFSDAIKNFFKI